MKDIELIYICAFRYSLGRKTYMPSVVIDFLRKKKLSKRAKEIMIKEINEAFDLGDECDEQEWLAFKNYLEEK